MDPALRERQATLLSLCQSLGADLPAADATQLALELLEENAEALVGFYAVSEDEALTPLFLIASNFDRAMTTPVQAEVACALARTLLQRGADPNAGRRSLGISPLHMASLGANVAMTDLLLRGGASPNLRTGTPERSTPLLAVVDGMEETSDDGAAAAAAGGEDTEADARLRCAELLLARGADPHLADADGDTALVAAARRGFTPLVALLLKHRQHMQPPKEEDGVEKTLKTSALAQAARCGRLACVKLLCQELPAVEAIGRVEVESDGNAGEVNDLVANHVTPLHLAAQNGHTAVVEYLLGLPTLASVDTPDVDGWTPLFFAVMNAHPGPTKLLLDAGADPNLCAVGRGLRDSAEEEGRKVVVNAVTALRPISALICTNGLYAAAAPEVAKLLIDAGAVLTTRSDDGEGITPLLELLSLACTQHFLFAPAEKYACELRMLDTLLASCSADPTQLCPAGFFAAALNDNAHAELSSLPIPPELKEKEGPLVVAAECDIRNAVDLCAAAARPEMLVRLLKATAAAAAASDKGEDEGGEGADRAFQLAGQTHKRLAHVLDATLLAAARVKQAEPGAEASGRSAGGGDGGGSSDQLHHEQDDEMSQVVAVLRKAVERAGQCRALLMEREERGEET